MVDLNTIWPPSKSYQLFKNISKSTNFSGNQKYSIQDTTPTEINIIAFHWLIKLSFNLQEHAVFYKKAVRKNLPIFTGKQLCWSLFLIRPANLLKETPTKVFSCEYFEILRTTILNKFCERLFLDLWHQRCIENPAKI